MVEFSACGLLLIIQFVLEILLHTNPNSALVGLDGLALVDFVDLDDFVAFVDLVDFVGLAVFFLGHF